MLEVRKEDLKGMSELDLLHRLSIDWNRILKLLIWSIHSFV